MVKAQDEANIIAAKAATFYFDPIGISSWGGFLFPSGGSIGGGLNFMAFETTFV